MPKDWARARGNRLLAAKELEKIIRGYDYSDTHHAELTNSHFCKIFLDKLRVSNNILFNIINTCYEMHIEGDFKRLKKIRDELDIFVDEVKVIYIEWNDYLSARWLEKLISHDLNLIRNSEMLAKNLESVFKKIMDQKKRDKKFWKKIDNSLSSIEEQLDGIVRMFREREALCSLKSLSFKKAYKLKRKEINEDI